jgi:hypothetical protein
MANNLSAIITANGDSEGTVWAFRQIQAVGAPQPRIQYGSVYGGTGGSVTTPLPYSSSSSFVVHVTMKDAPASQLYATPLTATSFSFGFSNAGGGAQYIMWTTIGT